MADIVLLDTSVFLNVLNIPGFNQHGDRILREFERRIQKQDHFLLPMATIWETGNHIAHLPDGRLRRACAEKLVKAVSDAFEGVAPFRPTYFPEAETFMAWLRDFPEHAQRNKPPDKLKEGVSLADLSIIKECERTRGLNRERKVIIWSLDSDLAAWGDAG
ncbi:MAG: hypothetical protein Q4B17_09930 [Lautropia sp.]|nr:hypothetical protein [Lautropia sp.]